MLKVKNKIKEGSNCLMNLVVNILWYRWKERVLKKYYVNFFYIYFK